MPCTVSARLGVIGRSSRLTAAVSGLRTIGLGPTRTCSLNIKSAARSSGCMSASAIASAKIAGSAAPTKVAQATCPACVPR